MSAIGRRMNSLTALSQIRTGPGAAILPPNITRIHLDFAHKHDKGHAGSRKFWRQHLPSLKYYNPAIPMIVNRSRDQEITPTLTIYISSSSKSSKSSAEAPLQLESSSSAAATKTPKTAVATITDPWQLIGSSSDGSSPAPAAQGGETAVKINLRGVLSDEIWKQFVAKTGATPVEPSAEEVEEMERMAALKVQAEYDRRVQKEFRDGLKKEKRMLDKARQEADALKDN